MATDPSVGWWREARVSSPHLPPEFSTPGDNILSYTGVIIPTVEEPVENQASGVGTVVWRTARSVDNAPWASWPALQGARRLWKDDDARRTRSGATGVE